jgi:subtilase family serine protease
MFATITCVNSDSDLKSQRLFFAIIIGMALFFSFETFAQTSPRKFLHGHVPPVVSHLTPIGLYPAANRLNLAIGLPLHNQAALDEFLRQLYDPASTNFHKYLTPQEYTESFGPTEQDYRTVIKFAEANGLTVTTTHSNRVVLDVEGSVSDIERAFQITLRVYQHPTEARTFYAPDVEPSVDADIPVLSVSGLDNFELPHPKNLNLAPPKKSSADAMPKSGSGAGGTYAGYDFRAAYAPGVTLDGSGQSVGLLEFDGYYSNDIASYENTTGLPGVTLTDVAVDGGVSIPGSGNDEVALDIEMAIAMAPGLSKVIVYEAPNPSPWPDLLNRIANDNLARQISCSWGGGSPDATSEQIFKQMAAQGQSFFNASGDSDAFVGSVPFPSDSTNITQVGGTTLTTAGPGGSWSSETVWNWGQVKAKYVGSSGGVSTFYSIPNWQQGINMTTNHGSTTLRNIPDVALTADNIWVAYNNGQSGTFGGTSAAAPLWAAFTALVNQQAVAAGQPAVGFINPAIYTIGKGANYTADFHNITTGNNFSKSSPTNFPAVPGYDLCTGWGTPNGTNLINALVPILPYFFTQPASQTVTNGTSLTFSVTVGGPSPVGCQ